MKRFQPARVAHHLEKRIKEEIIRFVKNDQGNHRKEGGGKYWDTPLIGFAEADNPLIMEYKKIIGRFHLTPREIFERTFGRRKNALPLSAISWVLPAQKYIYQSNRKETQYPSRLWAHTRNYSEMFNVKLRKHIVSFLKKKGYRAVAPMNSPFFRQLQSPKVGWASNWSERHIAYACGLGTFSLSDGLITPKGIAMRVGSVVTDLPLCPSPPKYPHPRANCLYFFNKTCKICASRCPAGAINSRGHDKDKCRAYIYNEIRRWKEVEYGFKISGCGLCQTKVPCEFEIPKLIQRSYRKGRS